MDRFPDLDDFDRRLLDLLRRDARMTGRELSERVGLSTAACLRRVQRLRSEGVILREVAVIAPEVEGPRVTLLTSLTLNRGRADLVDRLRRHFIALPEVERIYHVTGDSDLVLTLHCPSMEHYALFCEREFHREEIRGYDTTVVLRTFGPED